MSNALTAWRPLPLPSQSGRAVNRFFSAANRNAPRGTWSLPGEWPAPLAESGAARFLPGAAARFWGPLLAGVLVTEAYGAWLRYAYPGDNGTGFFVPAGAQLMDDGGPHGPSAPFHNNESNLRNGWQSQVGALPIGYHPHGQAPFGAIPAPNPAHQYMEYLEGCGAFSPGVGYYYRAQASLAPGLVSFPILNGKYLRFGALGLESAAPLPWYYPALDPFALPIGAPVPAPRPLPMHYPVRVPVGDPIGVPYPSPVRVPTPAVQPVPVPVPGVVSVPALEGVPAVRSGLKNIFHELRPPRSNEREGKRQGYGRAGAIVFGIASLVTESLDFLNAAWWALPKEYRSPWASPLQKTLDLIDFMNGVAGGSYSPRTKSHKMEWRDGKMRQWGVHPPGQKEFASWFVDTFKNITTNELQDQAIGRLAHGANQLTKNPYYVSPVGVGAGPAM